MIATLAWLAGLSWASAGLVFLLANAFIFTCSLVVGAALVRVGRFERVALLPAPVSTVEWVLAVTCVVLNSAVTLAGWFLWTRGFITPRSDLHWRALADVVVLTLAMDLGMYATHRIAHVPVLFRWVHGVHHRYENPRPLTLFVLHPLEVLGFGALWLLVLSLGTFSIHAILVYLTFNVVFGLVGHVGVEPFPSRWARWFVVRHVGTSTFHARHHQRSNTNFGFYTLVWDRLFGTLDPTYVESFGRLPGHRVR